MLRTTTRASVFQDKQALFFSCIPEFVVKVCATIRRRAEGGDRELFLEEVEVEVEVVVQFGRFLRRFRRLEGSRRGRGGRSCVDDDLRGSLAGSASKKEKAHNE